MLRTLKMITDFSTEREDVLETSALTDIEKQKARVLCEKGYCKIVNSLKWSENELKPISIILSTPKGARVIKIIYPSSKVILAKCCQVLFVIVFVVMVFLFLRNI